MAPSVAPWAQMGWTLAEVYGQRRGGLVDSDVLERCLDDHLAREFHAVTRQAKFAKRLLGDRPQSAMRIVDPQSKKQI